eukprot:1180949-Amphidinium_carterae.1
MARHIVLTPLFSGWFNRREFRCRSNERFCGGGPLTKRCRSGMRLCWGLGSCAGGSYCVLG